MFRRFNRWLSWQLKYHQDKKRAPEIIARIREERGLPPKGADRKTSAPSPEEVDCAVGLMLLTEARRSSTTGTSSMESMESPTIESRAFNGKPLQASLLKRKRPLRVY